MQALGISKFHAVRDPAILNELHAGVNVLRVPWQVYPLRDILRSHRVGPTTWPIFDEAAVRKFKKVQKQRE